MNLGQQGCRQAFQKGARQALGDQAERGVFAIVILFVRDDTRQQPA